MPTNRDLTTVQEADLARRAIRGESAFQLIGYQDPAAALSQQQPNSLASALQHAVINVSAPGTYPIIPGISGQRIQIFALFYFSEADQTLQFFDGPLTLTGPLVAWASQTGALFPFVGEPYFELNPGNPFNLSISAVGQVSGFAKFRQI